MAYNPQARQDAYGNRYNPGTGVNQGSSGILGGIDKGLSAIGGYMAGPQGFAVMALANIATGILGAFTKQKPELTPEQQQYQRMVKFYYKAGQRSKMYEGIATAVTGRDYTGKFAVPLSEQVNRFGLDPAKFSDTATAKDDEEEE